MIETVHHEELKYRAIFFLALSGRLRREEILGLKIDDVKDKGVIIHEAKNISSERFVSLDDATMELLIVKIPLSQILIYIKQGYYCKNSTLVFFSFQLVPYESLDYRSLPGTVSFLNLLFR